MTVSSNSYDSYPFGKDYEGNVMRWADEQYAAKNLNEDQYNRFVNAYNEANLNCITVKFQADFMDAPDDAKNFGPFIVKDYEGPSAGHGSFHLAIAPAIHCFDQEAIYVDLASSGGGFYLSKKDFFDLCTAFQRAHRLLIARERAAKILSALLNEMKSN